MTDAEKLRLIAKWFENPDDEIDITWQEASILLGRIANLLDTVPPETIKALADKTWKAVPVEPTRIMWAAMGDAAVRAQGYHHDVVCEGVYRAGIAAAPEKPE